MLMNTYKFLFVKKLQIMRIKFTVYGLSGNNDKDINKLEVVKIALFNQSIGELKLQPMDYVVIMIKIIFM
jgi:hypothetical protein